MRFFAGNMVEIQQDFKELLGLFNKHGVDYIIVGSYALAYHGSPRYTGDMDLFVRSDRVVQLGNPPVRIDIMTSLSGITWKESIAEE